LTLRTGLLAIAAAALLAASAAALELPPENARTRERLLDVILGPPAQARWINNRLFAEDGHPVRFETSRAGDFTYYLFLNQSRTGQFPMVYEGNASIKRNAADGSLLYMTILLRRDSGSFLRLSPAGARVRLEAWLFGVPVATNVMIPVSFDQAVGLSLERLSELTGGRVDWDLIAGPGDRSADVARVLARARALMPRLSDEDDGAFDASGRPVLIATGRPSRGGLNCSGFAKWIMDGFYKPLTGRYMDIAALKTKDLSIRGNRFSEPFEAERDPFFGLDWTRNMAVALAEARTGREAEPESLDVRSVPFMEYVEDVGYPIDRIELALYLLAREEPDRVFLGSINRDFGRSPTLRQHTHVAVFFPLFDADGQFRVTVLERNMETGLDGLRARYPESHVHLVQVPAGGDFAPLDPATPRR
jgi:hypothetical protein